MSAFVVSEEHVSALVQAGLRNGSADCVRWYWKDEWRQLDIKDDADEIGRMLLAECIASVSARYPNDKPGELPGQPLDGPPQTPESYRYQARGPISILELGGMSKEEMRRRSEQQELRPVEVLKLISCYEYQSCEHDGWEGSQAKAYCDALRHLVIHRLPGYEEAPWEL